MSDVTAVQFYKAIDELKTFVIQRLDDKSELLQGHIDSKHSSLRQSVQEGFHDVAKKLDLHAHDSNILANRVTAIETKLEADARHALKTTTWLSIVIPTGITALLKWLWR